MSQVLVALALLTVGAHAQLRPADAPPHINDTRCGPECVRCAADGCVKCARLLIWPGGLCAHDCPAGTRESWAHDDHLMGRVCYPAHTYNEVRCGPECVRCAADGCVKCARLLIWPGGLCAHDCPAGTRESWAHDDHLMGRVCYPAHTYNEVLVGGACGVIICIALVAAIAAYARCRSSARAQSQPLPQPHEDDDAQLREFHKQLDCLRPHAYTLLAILNHTRHQVRELYQLGNNDAAMAYSCVLSDLAKLLILLNKAQVPVPHAYTLLAILNHTRHQVRELYQLGNNDAAMAYSCVLSDLAKLLILLNKAQVPVVPEEWPRLASWAESKTRNANYKYFINWWMY
ncbi:jg10779 [Pararge aegeria aegeria]|uniref:Jg10779 protein n=1 Tax=Pararge aegeria aegeria TaxID=348720 RepID=A0A8S4SJC7_9NEOP|nr:jg10779 [Pararge aegeria aegeria]